MGEVRLRPLIEEALKQNAEVVAARARLEAARARIPQALALPDPRASIAPETTSRFSRHLETEFNVSQTFPYPGKLRLQGLVAEHEGEQVREELRAKEREIASRVKLAFYELFRSHKFIDVKRAEVEILKTLARMVETRYEVGKAAQPDVLKAQVELSKALTSLVTLEQERETAQAALNAALGRTPRDQVGVPVPRDFTPFTLRIDELERLAQDQRPELAAAERAIQKARAAVDLANRQYLPDFTVGVTYKIESPGPNHWEVGVSINIPWLYTKSRYDARVQEAAAQAANARAIHDGLRIQTLSGVKDLSEKVKASERLVILYKTSILPQASQALEAAIVGYQTGQVDFLTLLESQRSLRETERAYFASWVDFEQRQAELERIVDMELSPAK
ncbi:MAG: TolC family protein [Actinomycetota bacterium]